MGDRANVKVVYRDRAVYLYTHWRGLELPGQVRDTLRDHRNIWTDDVYLAGQIFRAMCDGRPSQDSLGISARLDDGTRRVIVVDTKACMVWFERDGDPVTDPVPFKDFAALKGEVYWP